MSYEKDPKRAQDPLLEPPPGISLSAFFESFFAAHDARGSGVAIDRDGAEDDSRSPRGDL